jgi:hypothetical protein
MADSNGYSEYQFSQGNPERQTEEPKTYLEAIQYRIAHRKESKSKYFKDETIYVHGNIISCRKNFIQISNIAQTWYGPLVIRHLPKIVNIILVVIFFGQLIGSVLNSIISALSYGYGGSSSSGVAAFFNTVLSLGIIAFYVWWYLRQVKWFGVSLQLNSGDIYTFRSTHLANLEKIYKTISSIVSDGIHNEDVTVIMNTANGTVIAKNLGEVNPSYN